MSSPEITGMQQKEKSVRKAVIFSQPNRSKSEVPVVQKRGKTPLQPPVDKSFPKWLTETVPKPFPYFPQIGDVVYYYQEGHKKYVRRLIGLGISSKLFKGMPNASWNLKEVEELEIVALKFVNVSVGLSTQGGVPMIHHLAEIEMKRKGTPPNGSTFTISFCGSFDGMEDFLVLEHRVLRSQNTVWQEGARVRCLILGNNKLYGFKGTIDSVTPDAPGMYHMLNVRCDVSKSIEPISPWYLHLITPEEDESVADGCVVTAAELRSMAYQPTPTDWNNRDPARETRRILGLLHTVSSLPEAQPFAAPVNLVHYPDYVKKIAYPVDLKTIRQRLSLQFYRHKAALIFDFRQIAINCEKYNGNAPVTMQANIIVDVCTDIVNNQSALLVLGSAYIERIRMKWRTAFAAHKTADCRGVASVNSLMDSSILSDSDEEKSADDDNDKDFSLQPGDDESSEDEMDTEPPSEEMSEAPGEDDEDDGECNRGRKVRPQRRKAVPRRFSDNAFQSCLRHLRIETASDVSETAHHRVSRRCATESARPKSGGSVDKPLCSHSAKECGVGWKQSICGGGKRKTVEKPVLQRLGKRSASTMHLSYAESDLEENLRNPVQIGSFLAPVVWTETLSGRKVKRPQIYMS
ncbi:bromodomain and WD repeat-containing protein 3-like [Paramacrobiotus metropolitanus]|uniref:bromodomain and WD repeat-containing protein 3-like n=1 Tax=Paramacrobiotus metropolitanus TaxID=2943436 RepID=UPI0024462CDD|nr:bromodomain and WD repeat-containing protein 3-like [Paramacrobiotus metropolitanus]